MYLLNVFRNRLAAFETNKKLSLQTVSSFLPSQTLLGDHHE
jgi:hypothetical protein